MSIFKVKAHTDKDTQTHTPRHTHTLTGRYTSADTKEWNQQILNTNDDADDDGVNAETSRNVCVSQR